MLFFKTNISLIIHSRSPGLSACQIFLIDWKFMRIIDFEFEGGGRFDAVSALLQFYPNYSFKRRLLKGINCLNQLGPIISSRQIKKLAAVYDRLPCLSIGGKRTFLLHKVNQNGRVYIFDQNSDGKFTKITKLALNNTAALGLKRESEVLKMLAGRTEFQIPEVKLYEDWKQGGIIQLSAVCFDHLIHDKRQNLPETLLEAIAKLRNPSAPKTLPSDLIDGWQIARKRASTPLICKIANKIQLDNHFEVSAAHRDLGSENVFYSKNSSDINEFTLIDWEFFSETAPAMTDQVSLWLGHHHRHIKGWGKPRINMLASDFLFDFKNTPGGRASAVLALLHLAEMGIDLAQFITGERK